MSTREEHLHMSESLGAYVLGALDDAESRAVAAHLADCPECRAQVDELVDMKDALGEVPPEAFLDGPPQDGDLVLQRTLRQVRAEKASGTRSRNLVVTAAAVVAVAIALGGGVILGRGNSTTTQVALPPPVRTTPSVPAGTKYMSGTNGDSRINVEIMPAAGWIRVNASVTGIPQGQKCVLVVKSKSGDTLVAGSWLVGPKAAKNGTNLDGSALVPADQVESVSVQNTAGHTFVSASTA
jgi:anti-sigma factor RsiW